LSGDREHRIVAHPSSGSRLAGIEGLRALAASSIVVMHCWLYSSENPVGSGGVTEVLMANLALGVTLFFCLSGFLLYRPFAAAIARGRPLPSIAGYFRNRTLRIVPAYWVILVVTALVLGAVRIRDPSGALGVGHLSDLTLLQSILLVQHYHPSTLATGIGPAWSLAVEVVFYLALPMLAIVAARIAAITSVGGRRIIALMFPPLLLLLVGISGKYVAGVVVPAPPTAGWDQNWHSVIERSFWAQADLFSFGMMVAVARVEVADGRLRLAGAWRPAALVVAALLLVPCALTFDGAQLSYLPQNTVVALAFSLVLATVVVAEPRAAPWRGTRLLETGPLTAVGVVSYSLFLWHEPLQLWLRDHGLTFGGWGGLVPNLLVIGVVAGSLSALTYRFVEAPALRRKRSTGVAPPVPGAQLQAAP